MPCKKMKMGNSQVDIILNIRRFHIERADFRISSPGFRTGRGKQTEGETEQCRLQGRQGISSVQADVRTIRGAPQCIVHSSCQP